MLRSFGLFALSSFLLGISYTLTPAKAVKAEPSGARAIASLPILQQGEEVSLNGRQFPVAWIQWNQGASTRIGVSDTGAMQMLGLELLSTQKPDVQPISWFSPNPNQPITLQAQWNSPYRYLDITDVIQQGGAQFQIVGKSLNITLPPAKIQSIRQGNQAWGKRIIIDLDRPVFWQVSQGKEEGVVTIEGVVPPELLAQFQRSPSTSRNGTKKTADEDDLGSRSSPFRNSQFFSLESARTTTKLRIDLPAAHGLHVSSLSNPPRLVVDIRPDAMVEREILWTPGVLWRQQFVSLNNGSKFPVNLLEIDLSSPNISLKLITSNPNALTGIAPLATTSRNFQAIAAINGGFFNRDNKLPLGAIRQDSRWLSSPILNRGAIAWNNQGQVKIGRLSLQETLTTSSRNRFPLVSLNSGYTQAGIARYTREWGTTYTPLTDNEIVISVQNNQVLQQFSGTEAGKGLIPIPTDGYLLTLRSNNSIAADLRVGTQVNLDSTTVPVDFANYPQILGAGPLLLQNGQIVLDGSAEKFSKAFQEQRASRSAIATTSQGKLIVVAVHNRVGGRGATLGEFAQIMQRLGAIDALNLDGGSSTSLYLGGQLIDRSPVTAARVHNGIGIFLSP